MKFSAEKCTSIAVEDSQFNFLEIILIFVLSASLLGLILASLEMFLPGLVLFCALLIALIYWHFFNRRLKNGMKLPGGFNYYHILIIIFVALAYRIPVFHYILGGQDQGVYVNMASSILNSGSIKTKDPVIDSFVGGHYNIYFEDNYKSSYLPGVYIATDVDGRKGVEFQFYHLFPIWMAFSEGVFGAEASVYALTFFSLLSLLFIYQFVGLMTGRSKYGLVAALLVAVNPLHSFFSRWPVTEVPTLAFAMAGFAGLLAYYKTNVNDEFLARRFLFLSAFSFACLFFTRISGFLYIPIFFLIYFGSIYRGANEKFSRKIALWFWGVISLYGLSVIYGLHFSENYSKAIYQIIFSKIFGEIWIFAVLSLVLVFLVICIGVYIFRNNNTCRRAAGNIIKTGEYWAGVIFGFLIIVAVYRIYAFSFTDRYESDPWIQGVWKLSNKGMESIAATSLVATIIAVSPFLWVVFCYLMFKKCELGIGNLLKMVIIVVFSYIGILQFFLPYQPYYDRYLVSELVPYIIIFLVIFFAWMPTGRLRSYFKAFMLVGGIFAGGLSLMHVGKVELSGAYEGLERVANNIGKNDVVLLHGEGVWGEIKMPLVYKFNKNVVSISDESLENDKYLNFIAAEYDNVYLLTTQFAPDKRFISRGIFRVVYDKFNRTNLPAHSVGKKNYRMMLYQMDKSSISPGIWNYGDALFRFIGPSASTDVDGLRSNGTSGFLVYGPYRNLPSGKYQLSVIGESKNVNSSWVDVVSRRGRLVHGRNVVFGAVKAGGLISSMTVILPEEATDVEVRVYAGGNDEVTVNGYELVKILGD